MKWWFCFVDLFKKKILVHKFSIDLTIYFPAINYMICQMDLCKSLFQIVAPVIQ